MAAGTEAAPAVAEGTGTGDVPAMLVLAGTEGVTGTATGVAVGAAVAAGVAVTPVSASPGLDDVIGDTNTGLGLYAEGAAAAAEGLGTGDVPAMFVAAGTDGVTGTATGVVVGAAVAVGVAAGVAVGAAVAVGVAVTPVSARAGLDDGDVVTGLGLYAEGAAAAAEGLGTGDVPAMFVAAGTDGVIGTATGVAVGAAVAADVAAGVAVAAGDAVTPVSARAGEAMATGEAAVVAVAVGTAVAAGVAVTPVSAKLGAAVAAEVAAGEAVGVAAAVDAGVSVGVSVGVAGRPSGEVGTSLATLVGLGVGDGEEAGRGW